MKSIRTQAIRRANLKRLVDCIGSQKELARILDMNPSHINTMLHGKRTITGKAARKMEKRLGLESCWLDDDSHGEDRCAQTRTIVQLLNRGVGLISIARMIGGGVSAVQRVQFVTRC